MMLSRSSVTQRVALPNQQQALHDGFLVITWLVRDWEAGVHRRVSPRDVAAVRVIVARSPTTNTPHRGLPTVGWRFGRFHSQHPRLPAVPAVSLAERKGSMRDLELRALDHFKRGADRSDIRE